NNKTVQTVQTAQANSVKPGDKQQDGPADGAAAADEKFVNLAQQRMEVKRHELTSRAHQLNAASQPAQTKRQEIMNPRCICYGGFATTAVIFTIVFLVVPWPFDRDSSTPQLTSLNVLCEARHARFPDDELMPGMSDRYHAFEFSL